MKYTAQQILRLLLKNNSELHAAFKVNKYDRDYPRLTVRAGTMEKRTIKY